MRKITPGSAHPLYSIKATRQIEQAAQATLAPHTLMSRAGLAVAQLALAIAPHARRIWIACGSGNNGGDGMEAAVHLKRWGKQPIVTWLGNANSAPSDAARSHQRAVDAGVTFAEHPPNGVDLCIDALLGIGARLHELEPRLISWITHMQACQVEVLAVDLPTGLHADTGQIASHSVLARHTLSLLTLKPGLFTAHGRDAAGTVWLDDLGVHHPPGLRPPALPAAWLPNASTELVRRHASHKGDYGDVAVIGGAPGMTGAALLAAGATLHAGAGRVFVGLLEDTSTTVDFHRPELMFRPIPTLDFSSMTVVCGCGGTDAIRGPLPRILSTARHTVLDADALNALACDSQLQTLLRARGRRPATTVLTPHPLEAARLLETTTTAVQSDRLAAAQSLSQRFECVVILKGSGTIITAPNLTPVINSTGNAKLSTAGTGDVLAGMVGARLALGLAPFQAACEAAYLHGEAADLWSGSPLVAGALAQGLHRRGQHLPIC